MKIRVILSISWNTNYDSKESDLLALLKGTTNGIMTNMDDNLRSVVVHWF